MSKNLIDTNLIIRFFVNDDPVKVSRVERLLKDSSNHNIIPDTVIAEIIWVLNSYYSLEKQEVIDKVMALIHVDSVECNAFLIGRALKIWKDNNISYIDSYLAAFAELGNMTLYTYDKRLSSIHTISVSEP